MSDATSPAIARHFGLDWLRIGAFALLILYHIRLYFAPGPWIVKSPQPVAWVAWPIAAVVPWRLTLLFAISGYATAAMMARTPAPLAFLRDRSLRLLIPLLFAMLVIVPPQDWVRFEVGGIDHSYWQYLTRDLFSFRVRMGVFLPNWEHLWFLPRLLAYTAIVTAGIVAVPGWKARVTPAVDWLARDGRLLYVPFVAIIGLFLAGGKLHLGWLVENADYFPAFVLGFAYAHFPVIRQAFARLFPFALAVTLVALAGIFWRMATPPAEIGRLAAVAGIGAEYLMSWAMMPVLFQLAETLLDRDHRLRAPLSAAVFPAYLVHQSVIVLTGWNLTQRGITGLPALLAMLGCVLLGCYLAWRLARASAVAGYLLGMPHKPQAKPVAAPPACLMA